MKQAEGVELSAAEADELKKTKLAEKTVEGSDGPGTSHRSGLSR